MAAKVEPFWIRKTLEQLDQDEWESLCDGCGLCCLQKLEDEDDNSVYYTRIACKLLDLKTCQCPEYTHPDRALYIFGPEDGSLDKEIRDWCEDVIYIPTTGCMNLAATVNVVLYDRLAKGNNTRSGPKY